MKCENCNAWNARVINIEDQRMLLCSKCLKIYKDLNKEYHSIVKCSDGSEHRYFFLDEQTSSEHIVIKE